MMNSSLYSILPEIQDALRYGLPVLALESTIIAHGMPYPQNVVFAREADRLVRSVGVIPATIAIISGKICVGLDNEQLEHIASDKNIYKVAVRDLSHNVSNGFSGATTVSATMRVAHKVGISVFSTGGIGRVHRDWSSSADVAQDLHELGRTSLVVFSSRAKGILKLAHNVEFL